jgi:transcriptional regulator with XRE-family HTH domain
VRSISRRRVKGLRRDEVADLAGVSVTWYAWLEQGRPIRVSARTLDRIASALQCAKEERAYLFNLAGESPPPTGLLSEPPPSNIQLLLDALDPNPAYVVCPRFNLVAWNAGAVDVFGDFARYPKDSRNLLWILLTDPAMRELFVDWQRLVRCFIAWFRHGYAKADGSDEWVGLVSRLEHASPEFVAWWKLHEVATSPDWAKVLRHKSGTLTLDPISLRVNSTSNLSIVAFTPAPATDTAAILDRLAGARRDNVGVERFYRVASR